MVLECIYINSLWRNQQKLIQLLLVCSFSFIMFYLQMIFYNTERWMTVIMAYEHFQYTGVPKVVLVATSWWSFFRHQICDDWLSSFPSVLDTVVDCCFHWPAAWIVTELMEDVHGIMVAMPIGLPLRLWSWRRQRKYQLQASFPQV